MRSITSGATEAPKKTGTLKGSFGNHDDERRSRVPPGFRGPLPDGPVPLPRDLPNGVARTAAPPADVPSPPFPPPRPVPTRSRRERDDSAYKAIEAAQVFGDLSMDWAAEALAERERGDQWFALGNAARAVAAYSAALTAAPAG